MNLNKKTMSRFLWDFIFPNKCPVCMRAIKWDRLCCDECRDILPYLKEGDICNRCGRSHSPDDLCEADRSFDFAFGAMLYEGKGKKAMYNFKRRYALNLAEIASQSIYSQLDDMKLPGKIDCVTYVPMHPRKEYKRGYNQAKIFAKALSEALGAPLAEGMMIHKRSNTQQHELTGAERKEAARKTYALGSKAREPHEKVCILADDVLTTGSTLDTCAGLLKSIGFETIICAAICVTPYRLADDEYEEGYDSPYYYEDEI